MPGRMDPISIKYRNHRGEVAVREIIPHEMKFGTTEWHTEPEPQWFLVAWDCGKQAMRSFAFKDILETNVPKGGA